MANTHFTALTFLHIAAARNMDWGSTATDNKNHDGACCADGDDNHADIALRPATVDNGAKVINMSFGKVFPQKDG